MPTGYTSEIYHGEAVSPKEYIMKCARAFGATVSMREEPLSTEIPQFEPSSFYQNALNTELKTLDRYLNMSLEEAAVEVENQYQTKLLQHNKDVEARKHLLKRYKDTLDAVEQWSPPTKEHCDLKKFAIDQLKRSIEADCEGFSRTVVKEDPKEYLEVRIDKINENIERYKEMHQEEIDKANKRNEWVNKLKESLNDLL
ncbi:hypothetical protein ACTHPT_14365 [Bacillus altitudinis]|uniref:hypothetical protein n=1 Tax=Bacillus altitudinis TaxID=293387 RepID=UPI003F7C4913